MGNFSTQHIGGNSSDSQNLNERKIEIKMTDFVVNIINAMHLFDTEVVAGRNTAKRTAQICIKYESPTHTVLRPLLSIGLYKYDIHFNLYGLESLDLNKEQELKVLRGLNAIADALEKEINYRTKGFIGLVTDLRQILKEEEDEQRATYSEHESILRS